MLKSISLRKIYRLEDGIAIKDCEDKEIETKSSNIAYRVNRTSEFTCDFVLNNKTDTNIFSFYLSNDIVTINNDNKLEDYIVVYLYGEYRYMNFKLHSHTGREMEKYYICRLSNNITSIYQSIMEYIKHMELTANSESVGLCSWIKPKYFKYSNLYSNKDFVYYIDGKKIKSISALPIDITRKIVQETTISDYSKSFSDLVESIYRNEKYKIK